MHLGGIGTQNPLKINANGLTVCLSVYLGSCCLFLPVQLLYSFSATDFFLFCFYLRQPTLMLTCFLRTRHRDEPEPP